MTPLPITTTRRIEARDVTDAIEPLADGPDGLLLVSAPHTTAAVILNEADRPLLDDLERTAGSLLEPFEPFSHARKGNQNAAAHLIACLLGGQCLMEVRSGRLQLGTHQRVLFLELDGPRERRIEVRRLALASAEGGAA